MYKRQVVGDLTATLPSLASPVSKKPKLAKTSDNIKKAPIKGECTSEQLLELNPATSPYPVPEPQSQPTQEPGTLKPTPT